MDPHSRLSQFNQRPPKAGPQLQYSRIMDPKLPAFPLEHFTKRSTSTPGSTRGSSPSLSRPMVTNSRVRRDEKYRKDMYLAFVNNALQQKAEGNGESFDELINQFNPKKFSGDIDAPPTQLRLWISALSHVVSQLGRPHAALVDAVVCMPWTTMDSTFVMSYVSFIGMLVSARPEYLLRVLEQTTQGLTHQSGLQALNTGFPESSSHPLTRRVVYDRLHNLLQHLISLIPTLPSALQPMLVRNFPHKRQNQVAQVTYIRNLLRVSEYCPELGDRILGLIIDRTIQIDVEIQVELEEIEADGAPDPGEVFTLDLFDNVIGQDGDESDSDSEDGEGDAGNLSDLSSDAGSVDSGAGRPNGEVPLDVKHVQDMVTKLDSILTVIFDHFNRTHSQVTATLAPLHPQPSPALRIPTSDPDVPHPLSIEDGKRLRRTRFYTLLAIFDRTIIRTFKSRYTQFLLFWYSSLDPEFTDTFQGFLVSKALLEETQPAVTRAAAASYIASFVSRAQFVDRESARRVVGLLCDFLASHLGMFDAGAMQSAAQHTVFYAVTQALFLVFCFRWRDLMEDEDGDGEMDDLGAAAAGGMGARKKWMHELGVVQRVLNSPLNPLKICSPNVIQQFARVAQHVGFVYCYSIMEANKRSEYSSSTSTPSPVANGLSDRSQTYQSTASVLARHMVVSRPVDADLTSFFPFDPYKLPKSSSYIQGVYREWSSVAIDDDDEEDEDEDEEEDYVNDTDEGAEKEGTQRIRFGPLNPSSHDDGDAGGLGESFGGMSISPIRPRGLVVS